MGPVPRLLVALTVQVYVLPALRPVTVSGPVLATLPFGLPPLVEVQVTV